MNKPALERVSPDELKLEYVESSAIPVFAARLDGTPLTGVVYASRGVVDWNGPFKDGLPHGQFHLVWGDRMPVKVWLEKGKEVGAPPGVA